MSQNTIDFLNDTVTNTTRTEFQAHRDQRDAHTARNIAIQNAFVYIRGSNLQASVESIDATFNLFREYDRQMQAQISQLIGDITNLPTTITTIADQRITNAIATNTVAAGNHNHDARYVEAGGDTMTGNLDMGGREISNLGPLNLAVAATLDDHETRIANIEGTDTPRLVLSADINGNSSSNGGGIIAGYGVGGFFRVGTGNYIITFATPMTNTNYTVVGSGEEDGPSEGVILAVTENSKTTAGFGFRTVNMSDTHTDTRISLMFFSMP